MSDYHKPKLSRFDFDVFDFMMGTSYMSATEIGQYMLLLCHEWADDKDCTLPDDDEKLARIARVEPQQCYSITTALPGLVSPLVLEKFTKTEGGRLVNERLQKEWRAAKERQSVASDKANKRWDKTKNAKAMLQHSNGNADDMPISISNSSTKCGSSGEGRIVPGSSDEFNMEVEEF
jgi:uncharacterized protein YdaU (DUF1376 family)